MSSFPRMSHLHDGYGAVCNRGPVPGADKESARDVRTRFGYGFFGEIEQSDHIVDFGQGESVGFIALRAKYFGQGVSFLLLVDPSVKCRSVDANSS